MHNQNCAIRDAVEKLKNDIEFQKKFSCNGDCSMCFNKRVVYTFHEGLKFVCNKNIALGKVTN